MPSYTKRPQSSRISLLASTRRDASDESRSSFTSLNSVSKALNMQKKKLRSNQATTTAKTSATTSRGYLSIKSSRASALVPTSVHPKPRAMSTSTTKSARTYESMSASRKSAAHTANDRRRAASLHLISMIMETPQFSQITERLSRSASVHHLGHQRLKSTSTRMSRPRSSQHSSRAHKSGGVEIGQNAYDTASVAAFLSNIAENLADNHGPNRQRAFIETLALRWSFFIFFCSLVLITFIYSYLIFKNNE